MLRSTFWPSKLLWLHRTKPKLFARVATWASPVDWIFYQLFGATGCSASIASGTGLYDLKEGDWDEELCAICHIKRSQLVPLRPVVEPTRWPRSSSGPAAIFTAIGDGAAGNLGSGADHQRVIAINVGTSAAVRMTQTADQAARTKVPFGLFRYVVDENRSVMGGAVSNAGNLRAWCLRELQLTETQADRALSRTAAVEDALSILPFWVSERAPSWPDRQLGVVDGLNQSTRASDIYRAATVAVFYRLAQILELIEKATNRSRHIILSGGILHSAAATRLLADALARDIEIAPEAEASLEGAAIHALTAMGLNVQAARPRRTIKYDRKLASKHRQRRERQMALEKVLTRSRGWPL
jgi:gluconokinase